MTVKEKVFELLEEIKKSGILIPPRVPPPVLRVFPGAEDKGELSPDLKVKYTAIEFCICEVNSRQTCGTGEVIGPGDGVDWETARVEAVGIFLAAFNEKYGRERIPFLCSDWHVYAMPN